MRLFQRAEAGSGAPARSAVSCVDAEWTLFAAVEDWMESAAPGAARRLLARVAAECQAEGAPPEAWPAKVAARISERLQAQAAGDPSWVFYAGVAISASAVHVCTAGDLRVHLWQEGRVLRVTRDHVLRNESPEWVRATYPGLRLEFHGSMATRSLGLSELPPESVSWPSGSGSVFVCSSDLHRYEPPETYAAELLASPPEDGGLFVRLDRRAMPAAAGS